MAVDKLVDSAKLDACCTAEANAIRAKSGGSAQIAYDFANSKGFSDAIAAIPSGGGDRWVRPASWPNLDLIDLTEEAIYYTYVISRSPQTAFISIDARTSDNAQWVIERGSINSSGVFTADFSANVNSNTTYRQLLDPQDGDVQLWRIRPTTGHLTLFGFFGALSTVFGRYYENMSQPCVERVGNALYATSIGSGGSFSYNNYAGTTAYMERDHLKLRDVTTLISVYKNGYSIVKIDTRDWDLSNCTNFVGLFQNCYRLSELDLDAFNNANITAVCTYMFSNCKSLKNVDLTKLKFKPTNIGYIFATNIFEEMDLRNLDMSECTNMGWAISNESFCKRLNIAGWDCSSVTIAGSTFYGFDSLEWFDATDVEFPSGQNPLSNCNFPMLQDYWPIVFDQNQRWDGSTMLTHDSLMRMINTLPTVTTARTFNLGVVNRAKLTEQEIAIATGKGWTVT